MFGRDPDRIPLRRDNKDTVSCCTELCTCILGIDFDIRCYTDRTFHKNSELVCTDTNYRIVALDDRTAQNYGRD